VGAPDDHWGERVVAFVVAEGEHPVDLGKLEGHCRKHLAGFKVPKEYRFADEVPRNPTGKLLRRVLRDRIS
jgi:fatty-acyl-CoA synthase